MICYIVTSLTSCTFTVGGLHDTAVLFDTSIICVGYLSDSEMVYTRILGDILREDVMVKYLSYVFGLDK